MFFAQGTKRLKNVKIEHAVLLANRSMFGWLLCTLVGGALWQALCYEGVHKSLETIVE